MTRCKLASVLRSAFTLPLLFAIVACGSHRDHAPPVSHAHGSVGSAGDSPPSEYSGSDASVADGGASQTGDAGDAVSSDAAADAAVLPQDAGAAPTDAGEGAGSGAGKLQDFPDVVFGFQAHVPQGSEMLRCIWAQMPTDRGVIAVPNAESHYTPGSHHMLAYRSDLTAIPNGQTGVWDCDDGAWQIHDKGSYYEAQQPDSSRSLPPGVAAEFQPGEILILQAHYLNASENDIDAHVQLIMHTVDVATVQQEAGSILFSDGNISIAPHAKARMQMTCPIPLDINLALLWSHMHSRAVDFNATTDDTAAMDALGGMLYHEPDWSEPQPRTFPDDPPVVIHAGSHITFACDYQNDTDNTFVYGNSAETNEMCILHGMYWPRMKTAPGAEGCRGGKTTRTSL
jgi:hypothetical protein